MEVAIFHPIKKTGIVDI